MRGDSLPGVTTLFAVFFVQGGIWCSSLCLALSCCSPLSQVFVVLFRRSTGRLRHLVPSPMFSPFVALLYDVLLVSLAVRNLGILFFVTPGSQTALPVSVLTSRCSAERHCAVSPSVSSLAWHRRACHVCMCFNMGAWCRYTRGTF